MDISRYVTRVTGDDVEMPDTKLSNLDTPPQAIHSEGMWSITWSPTATLDMRRPIMEREVVQYLNEFKTLATTRKLWHDRLRLQGPTPTDATAMISATERVIEYLEKYGWIQDQMYNNAGSACTMGAFIKSQANDEIKCRHWAYLLYTFIKTGEIPNTIPVTPRIGESDIYSWNDRQGRTIVNVIETLRNFIYALKGL